MCMQGEPQAYSHWCSFYKSLSIMTKYRTEATSVSAHFLLFVLGTLENFPSLKWLENCSTKLQVFSIPVFSPKLYFVFIWFVVLGLWGYIPGLHTYQESLLAAMIQCAMPGIKLRSIVCKIMKTRCLSFSYMATIKWQITPKKKHLKV